MVTSLMPRINFLMSHCAYVSSTEWWDGKLLQDLPMSLDILQVAKYGASSVTKLCIYAYFINYDATL